MRLNTFHFFPCKVISGYLLDVGMSGSVLRPEDLMNGELGGRGPWNLPKSAPPRGTSKKIDALAEFNPSTIRSACNCRLSIELSKTRRTMNKARLVKLYHQHNLRYPGKGIISKSLRTFGRLVFAIFANLASGSDVALLLEHDRIPKLEQSALASDVWPRTE